MMRNWPKSQRKVKLLDVSEMASSGFPDPLAMAPLANPSTAWMIRTARSRRRQLGWGTGFAEALGKPTDDECYPCAKGDVLALPDLGSGDASDDGRDGIDGSDGGIPRNGGAVNEHRADENKEIRHDEQKHPRQR